MNHNFARIYQVSQLVDECRGSTLMNATISQLVAATFSTSGIFNLSIHGIITTISHLQKAYSLLYFTSYSGSNGGLLRVDVIPRHVCENA